MNETNHRRASVNASIELARFLSKLAKAKVEPARILIELAQIEGQKVYQTDMLEELAQFLRELA